MTFHPPPPPERPASEQRRRESDLVVALVRMLPEPGTAWPVEERIRWLRAAVEVFALAYGGNPDCIGISRVYLEQELTGEAGSTPRQAT